MHKKTIYLPTLQFHNTKLQINTLYAKHILTTLYSKDIVSTYQLLGLEENWGGNGYTQPPLPALMLEPLC